jgi:putative tryptophan/tyrosine transport system substrate-binding protein
MRRRQFISFLVGAAIGLPSAVRGQQGGVWRLGALETTSQAMNSANYSILREALRDLGYVEGQNLVIEYRSGRWS